MLDYNGRIFSTSRPTNYIGPLGKGEALTEAFWFGVLPALSGTVLGMLVPFRRGLPIPSYYLRFVTRADWWPHLLGTFLLYASMAFFLVHFLYRRDASLQPRDIVEYAVTAWTLSGYVCGLPALFAFRSAS